MNRRNTFWLIIVIACLVTPLLLPARAAASGPTLPLSGPSVAPSTPAPLVYPDAGVDCKSMLGGAGGGPGREVAYEATRGNPAILLKLPPGDLRPPTPDWPYDTEVRALYSPDGTMLATGDGSVVRLWDAARGGLKRVLRDSEGLSRPIFSPDGQVVAAVRGDDEIGLFRVSTGRLNGSLAVPLDAIGESSESEAKRVLALGYSPDGRYIAAARGPVVYLFDAATRREVRRLKAQPVSVEVDEDGYAWGHGDAVESLSFSPNGQALVSVSDASIRLWDVRTGKQLRCFGDEVYSGWGHSAVEFGPDGRSFVVVKRDGRVERWDALTGAPMVDILSREAVNSASFSPDGRQILTTSVDETARLWDARNGTLQGVMRLPGAVGDAAFSPDGRRAITSFILRSAGDAAEGWREAGWVWDAQHRNLRLAATALQLEEAGVELLGKGDFAGAATKFRQATAQNPDREFSVPTVKTLNEFCRQGAVNRAGKARPAVLRASGPIFG